MTDALTKNVDAAFEELERWGIVSDEIADLKAKHELKKEQHKAQWLDKTCQRFYENRHIPLRSESSRMKRVRRIIRLRTIAKERKR